MSGAAPIKAIETAYKGYRFRSRLEARWAVFFDALGLRWEYEPEGFETSAGWYLPDFRVTYPRGDVYWFEVKADASQVSENEWARMLAFDAGGTILLDGVPEVRPYLPVRHALADNGEAFPQYPPPGAEWSECPMEREKAAARYFEWAEWGHRIAWPLRANSHFLSLPKAGARKFWGWWLLSSKQRPWHDCWREMNDLEADSLRALHAAVCAARSARFEHGETPR